MFTLFDGLMPGFLLEQRNESMFPSDWHIAWNKLWLTQTVICFLWLIYNKRWIAAFNIDKKSWMVWQFRAMLLTHSLFYVVELYSTDIIQKYTPMAFHHWFALIVFSTFMYDSNTFAVITLLPIVIHGSFWVLGADNMELLGVYNMTLLACGVVTFFNNVAVGPKNKPVSNALGLTAMFIAGVNYFTYCHSYRGQNCLPNPFKEEFLSTVTFKLYVAEAIIVALVGITYFAGMQLNQHWSKTGFVPHYARRAVNEMDTLEEGLSKSFTAPSKKENMVETFAGRFLWPSAFGKLMDTSLSKSEETVEFLPHSGSRSRSSTQSPPPVRKSDGKSL
ncbi:hypothetical protein HDU97_000290 [Phlyctochytrium planicorne]|nr:hypothetical protein HDU97_000290 [Phlyctochytrium planicorne]